MTKLARQEPYPCRAALRRSPLSTTDVAITPTRNPQKASERYMPMIRPTKCSEDSTHTLICWIREHRRGANRRCRRAAGTPPERPRVRRGGLRDNRPAPGRGTTPPSEHPVDSLRSVRVSAEALDAIARRLGV